MEDLAAVDHRLEPGAALCRALDRQQQRQQLLVRRVGVFLQRTPQGQVLGLALLRQPGRVGGDKCERSCLVLAVLGQVEVHAADEVPGRIVAPQELLNVAPRFEQFGGECRVEVLPQRRKCHPREVFRARHGWGGIGQRRQHVVSGRHHLHLGTALLGVRQRAQRGYVARREVAPVGQNGRQRSRHFARTELQQAMARAARERLPKTVSGGGFQQRCVVRLDQRQTAVRREHGRQRGLGVVRSVVGRVRG